MIAEVSAFKLKLDAHPLPLASLNLALRLAVRESGLNCLHKVAKFTGNHAEKKHNTVLVDWFMTQATEVDRVAIHRTILKPSVAVSGRSQVAGSGWSCCRH